jgi:hypothetical protein
MRFLTIAIAVALLSLPAVTAANARSAGAHTAKAATTDYAAKKKKHHRKHHAMKKPKEKVEYMRAVPSEPPK